MAAIPNLTEGDVTIRPVRLRDARNLERELAMNRGWLRQWEATSPHGPMSFDVRASIRNLQQNARAGLGLPFIIEVDGELAGQLNVSSISYGSLSSATIGYWVAERFAGRNVTPTAVALATRPLLLRCRTAPDGDLHPARERAEPAGRREARVPVRGAAAALHPHQRGLARPLLFALTAEELPQGVLRRWKDGKAPASAATVPADDRARAKKPVI